MIQEKNSMSVSVEIRRIYKQGWKSYIKPHGFLCKRCFEKDLKIEALQEELRLTKQRLRHHLNKKVTQKDLAYQPHEPSSRKWFKINASEENREKRGGAKKGHKGYGRKSARMDTLSDILEHPRMCPDCDVFLATKDTKTRTVIEVTQIKAKRKMLGLKRGQCPNCRRVYQAPIPLLPKSLYGNRLIAQAAVMHYLHGVSIGRLLEIFGSEVTEGGLIEAFHRLGRLCQLNRRDLIEQYRKSFTKQADETGWRTDGQSGYAWIFVSETVTLFEFRQSRAAYVAKEILGNQLLPGVLVVDRYAGYNRMPVKLQYCYAHLLREVEKLEQEFGDNDEVVRFVSRFSLLLTKAIKLRGLGLNRKKYLKKAQRIKSGIKKEVKRRYKHLGIRRIQMIFKEKKNRMYHWARDPRIPADNNRAERELRPTVVSRKISFGSQSEQGAKTRSHIMSILFTAKKRLQNLSVEEWLYDTLNSISQNPKLKLLHLLPSPP